MCGLQPDRKLDVLDVSLVSSIGYSYEKEKLEGKTGWWGKRTYLCIKAISAHCYIHKQGSNMWAGQKWVNVGLLDAEFSVCEMCYKRWETAGLYRRGTCKHIFQNF